ncbi:hypothetical protein ACFFU8_08925 [Chromobacterium piscinae]|uniref:hypothetical protein n=1 Tax=Chromobacterium piscinae TaxID=686831 RepID=UPI001E3300A2|nr:hypothetical protein [Chromobacterium piscinae]MCD5327973.1 hypothetical protein [Chromobacterium piscinae]
MTDCIDNVKNERAQTAAEKCRLCGCHLDASEDDDLTLELCFSCKSRPEARRLGIPSLAASQQGGHAVPQLKSARNFTPAEKSLISKVHGYMPVQQLLGLLNERLACDLGPDAMPYTMDQLHAEIGNGAGTISAGSNDWASLRKLLSQAKRNGVLDAINEQVINDFAVVFSLNPKQVLGLKDIVLQAEEDV